MKIGVVMAHYYKEMANSMLAAGSTRQGRQRKINAVTESLHALQAISQKSTYVTNCTEYLQAANEDYVNTIDIYVCTIGEQHILDKLPIPNFNKMVIKDIEPTLLTFACQMVLRDLYLKDNKYDFYCYIDDDIVIRDLAFFQKLSWLNKKLANEDILIMPYCYEESRNPNVKLYINHEASDKHDLRRFQNLAENCQLLLEWNEIPVRFIKPYNPYSASYFLSNKQMQKVVSQGNFAKMISFAGPLESGVMTNILDKFIIYKPCIENASFLEVEHFGDAYLKGALYSAFSTRIINTR